MFQVSGFSEGLTLSVESDIVTKSTRKQQQNNLKSAHNKQSSEQKSHDDEQDDLEGFDDFVKYPR